MLNDWSHKVQAISKKYCPGNIKILPSLSQSVWKTRFNFGHQMPCMDNNTAYFPLPNIYLYDTQDIKSNLKRMTDLQDSFKLTKLVSPCPAKVSWILDSSI